MSTFKRHQGMPRWRGIPSCYTELLCGSTLNCWPSLVLRSSYRPLDGVWEVGCSLASLGGGGGLRHVLAPCLWLRRKPSITSVPLNAAVPQCTVSDFNTWSTLSLRWHKLPYRYGQPTLFVSFGAFYCFLCKQRVNWMFCVAGKGKRLLVTDSSCRQSSWSTDWLRQSFAIMGIPIAKRECLVSSVTALGLSQTVCISKNYMS